MMMSFIMKKDPDFSDYEKQHGKMKEVKISEEDKSRLGLGLYIVLYVGKVVTRIH